MIAEQEKQVAEILAYRKAIKGTVVTIHDENVTLMFNKIWGHISNALSIIDDLQMQQPKRYTEGELRAEFETLEKLNWLEEMHGASLSREGGGYRMESVNNRFIGWNRFAKFGGMIKTEGES